MGGRSFKSATKSEDVKELKKKLTEWCDEHHKSDKTFSLQLKTPKIKAREKRINCKTFHGAGICVPVDSRSVILKISNSHEQINNKLFHYNFSRGFGYREVPETEGTAVNIKTNCVNFN